MAAIAAVSRVLYSMGRDRMLPQRLFGRLSTRFGTPLNNILLTSALALTAVFSSDNLLGAASLTSFGAITGFVMVNVSVICHFVTRGFRDRLKVIPADEADDLSAWDSETELTAGGSPNRSAAADRR